jgi:uncharacterized protein YutE (UPF0331/DUF86 family)
VLTAAAERHLQVAIQSCLDIGSILLSDAPQPPTTYRAIFPALAQIGVLPADSAERLADMAAFRNVLVHPYIEVDPELLHAYVQEGLDDLERYTRYVAKYLANRDQGAASGGVAGEGAPRPGPNG